MIESVSIKINGETHALRLTLGALAEIEALLGGGDFEGLKNRLENPRIGDLVLILHALLKGGGAGLTLEALKAADVDFAEAGAAIAGAFAALNRNGEAQSEGSAPGKPQGEGPARSPGPNGSRPASSS